LLCSGRNSIVFASPTRGSGAAKDLYGYVSEFFQIVVVPRDGPTDAPGRTISLARCHWFQKCGDIQQVGGILPNIPLIRMDLYSIFDEEYRIMQLNEIVDLAVAIPMTSVMTTVASRRGNNEPVLELDETVPIMDQEEDVEPEIPLPEPVDDDAVFQDNSEPSADDIDDSRTDGVPANSFAVMRLNKTET
jgi:hypothetical protein